MTELTPPRVASPRLSVRTLQAIGGPIIEQAGTLREILALTVATFGQLFHTPWRWREIAQQIVQIGVGSLPIITISTAFAGLVVTNQIAWHMDEALHTIQMIPGFTGQFILRELGIAIPALLMVSKVGAAITAEVGTMKVTEQIDALKLLKINPVAYLVFPRWIASIVSLAVLTLVAVAVTMGFAIGVAVVKYNFGFLEYMNMLRRFIGPGDIGWAVVKAMVFGSTIPIVACAYGFRCKGGAEGVGTATTNAVVTSTIIVIVQDFILTFLSTFSL